MCTKSCASIPAMSEAGNHSWGRLGSPIEKLLALEKVGDQVIKGLGKLRTQVEESLEDARLDVGDLETRKAFQEKSKRLMKVEDDITLLVASIAQWKTRSIISSGEFDVTSKVDNSGKYLVTEPSLSDENSNIRVLLIKKYNLLRREKLFLKLPTMTGINHRNMHSFLHARENLPILPMLQLNGKSSNMKSRQSCLFRRRRSSDWSETSVAASLRIINFPSSSNPVPSGHSMRPQSHSWWDCLRTSTSVLIMLRGS